MVIIIRIIIEVLMQLRDCELSYSLPLESITFSWINEMQIIFNVFYT